MKNLENLNLQELSFEEQVNTDGGWKKALYKAVATVAEMIISDPGRTMSNGWDSTPYGHYGGARP